MSGSLQFFGRPNSRMPGCRCAKIFHTVTERFLRYVNIDTQSSHNPTTYPRPKSRRTSAGCWCRSCARSASRTRTSIEYGYVYATVPANTDKAVPVICFCAHMDTSPDCTGKDVKPQIVRNYQGGDIVLPGDRARSSASPRIRR